MAPMSRIAKAIGLVTLSARTVLADCESYGMDFQNGGSYFQNSLSNANFTFVSQFDGCQNDTAFNVFVLPNGDQILCSNTQLQPDDTNQLSTCPDAKSNLTSGDYSVIVFSNNGNEAPIAYQRDFYLSVGPQSTSTYTPTVVISTTVTPVINTTVTTTSTTTTTLRPSTVTSPSVTVTPTTTIVPTPVITTTTRALLTVRVVSISASIVQSTATATATCIKPFKPWQRDPVATLIPNVGPWALIFSSKFKREYFEEQKSRFVKERRDRLALRPRAPDPQPLVVTETNTNSYITTTTTATASPITATLTTEAIATSTVTPPAVVVKSGRTTAAKVTVTAPTPTKTKTQLILATTTASTRTFTTTIVITSKTTPAAVKSSCVAVGGVLV